MAENEALSPCPFCGGKVIKQELNTFLKRMYFVCERCTASVYFKNDRSKISIRRWNARVIPYPFTAPGRETPGAVDDETSGGSSVAASPPPDEAGR